MAFMRSEINAIFRSLCSRCNVHGRGRKAVVQLTALAPTLAADVGGETARQFLLGHAMALAISASCIFASSLASAQVSHSDTQVVGDVVDRRGGGSGVSAAGPSNVAPNLPHIPELKTDGAARRSGQVRSQRGLLDVPVVGSPPAATQIERLSTEPTASAPQPPKDAAASSTTSKTASQSGQPAAATSAGTTEGQPAPQSEIDKAFQKQQQPPMNGSFTLREQIDLPAFRGLEPKLALSYDSNIGQRPTGATAATLGVGWRLDGVSEILRSARVGGTPAFDTSDLLDLAAKDTFLLDGEELVRCKATTDSPSCSSGGTHATRVESYKRIKYDTAANRWAVTTRDGTVYEYQSIGGLPNTGSPSTNISAKYRWLLTTIVDRHGNTVTYSHSCAQLPICWPVTIAYNGTTVAFKYDVRPDTHSYGTSASVATVDKRLRTIDIATGGQRVRSYALSYEAGSETGASRLTSIKTYGRDAVLDGNGIVTSGTALPSTTLTYSSSLPIADMGNVEALNTHHGDTSTPAWELIYGDFNGDGRSDVLRIELNPCSGGNLETGEPAACGGFNAIAKLFLGQSDSSFTVFNISFNGGYQSFPGTPPNGIPVPLVPAQSRTT